MFLGWIFIHELNLPQDQGGHQYNSSIFSKVTQSQLRCQYITMCSTTGFDKLTHAYTENMAMQYV